MSDNERDTQFMGSATQLHKELLEDKVKTAAAYRLRIARWAYDFARYVMGTVPPIDQDWPTVREWTWDIRDIPDPTERSEQQGE